MTSVESTKIGVLVLNFNGLSWLTTVYEALRRQQQVEVRIYLVDNASTDDSVRMTREAHPDVKIIRLSRNAGYSMAYNAASPIAFADGCDIIVWANSDIKLEPNCLSLMLDVLEADDKAGIVGPAFRDWSSDQPNLYMYGVHPKVVSRMLHQDPCAVQVDWVEGSLLMLRRACFEAVGPLDPVYFLYWEEADYCRRARYAGWRVLLAPTALARHYGGASTMHPTRIDWVMRLKARNEYLYRATDPAKSWLANLATFAHCALVKLKAGVLSREMSLVLESIALFDAFVLMGQINAKWRRDRAGILPAPWSADAPPPCWEVLSRATAPK